MAKVLIVYYSAFGHVYEMGKAVAKGAGKLSDTEVRMVKVPEFEDAKAAMAENDAYTQSQKDQEAVEEATHDDLRWADAIIWGIPTRYGSMPAQMKQYLDTAGSLWMNGELEGKATAVFTSTGSIHGGQETTILTSLVNFLHFGLIFVGLPYGENQEMLTTDGIGGSPYGPSTVAGPDGSNQPDEREFTMAERLGERVANVASKLHD
ncbi:NAD(P)H dehydrogenase (quinone) [Salsuginibacillus halophilus]|uniref:NAD(P)H dehydrogenase (Quinone) n=1 Tax=Salsuginibacillus halophilus TaxID=517424 RepID=A0A2P8H8B5_9BACI|nr:NAD(P)H:quinone oxidoreductase [Salsuginibacillus halophilus]PSL42444.1 NAD(P)H dehydrogenase (quinone) [Salsuginibacillus halophilus]